MNETVKEKSVKRKRRRNRNTKKTGSSFRFFLGMYAGLWMVLTLILCIILWKNLAKYQNDYDAAKAAGEPELAMQESMDLFLPENIGNMIDELQPEILSRFETIEQYKDFYENFLEDKTVSYVKDEGLYNDARPVYDVYASSRTAGGSDAASAAQDDDVLLAIVSFKAAGEKDSFGFNKWEIKEVAISENIYDYHDVYVKVMDDMEVYINGLKADEREYITGGVIDNAVSDKAYELTGVSFNYKVYYAGDMVEEPDVKVLDAYGNDVTDRYIEEENDLKNYESTASAEFIAGVQDRVRNFCETYVYHIYRRHR